MPSQETATALIGGAAGLVTGVLGTFFAPWVKWRYDNRLSMREDRKVRIEEWRKGIATLREAEKDRPVRLYGIPGAAPKVVPQDPDNAVATTKSWWVTLEPYLQEQKCQQVGTLQAQPLQQRKHAVSNLLEQEVARIEREVWRLV